jgi:hypothetical protein
MLRGVFLRKGGVGEGGLCKAGKKLAIAKGWGSEGGFWDFVVDECVKYSLYIHGTPTLLEGGCTPGTVRASSIPQKNRSI